MSPSISDISSSVCRNTQASGEELKPDLRGSGSDPHRLDLPLQLVSGLLLAVDPLPESEVCGSTLGLQLVLDLQEIKPVTFSGNALLNDIS